MNGCDDFFRFRNLHNQLVPGQIWRIAIEHPNSLESMSFMAKLLCKVKHRIPINCTICETLIQDETFHRVLECHNTDLQSIRNNYMTSVEHTCDMIKYQIQIKIVIVYALVYLPTYIFTVKF